jgi:chemotaxis protein methyltransferase CheR
VLEDEVIRSMIWSYEDFKKGIMELTAIDLSSYKERQMKRRIDALISRSGYNGYKEYFEALTFTRAMLEKFVDYLTINVSEFYRNPEHWRTLEQQILPDLIKKYGSIRVWSAACSTGEEPYSLTMMLSAFLPLNSIRILATDIDSAVIEKAKKGVYTGKSLETLPLVYKDAFFRQENGLFLIDAQIKNCVEFRQHDMLREPFYGKFHLILCRNVMIYFTEEAKEDLYRKFHDALERDGVLFVGSTEQIIFPQRYNLKAVRTYFYKRVDGQAGDFSSY